MKKSALVIGKPNAGKSTTIREFLKLVETRGLHVFIIDEKLGYTWLTSFEEYDRDVEETIEGLKEYDFLLFACQGPELEQVRTPALEKSKNSVYDTQRFTRRSESSNFAPCQFG